MTAGYSGTPLSRKLGLKPAFHVCVLDAPPHYEELLGEWPTAVSHEPLERGGLDFVHIFATEKARAEGLLARLVILPEERK